MAERLEYGFKKNVQVPNREVKTKQRTKGKFGEDQERGGAGHGGVRAGPQPSAVSDHRMKTVTLCSDSVHNRSLKLRL